MIYQKLTTGMGQCLLLIRKHADRDGFELWRRKERCWCYFNNVGAEYFKEFFDMRGELTDISEAEALELIPDGKDQQKSKRKERYFKRRDRYFCSWSCSGCCTDCRGICKSYLSAA